MIHTVNLPSIWVGRRSDVFETAIPRGRIATEDLSYINTDRTILMPISSFQH